MISTRKKGDSPIVAQAMEIMDKAAQGAELLAEAAAEPTLDIYLDRSPKLGTPINYEEMVGVLRKKRVAFITAEANKKAGVKPTEKTDDDEV